MCCNSNLDRLLNTDRYSFALNSCGSVSFACQHRTPQRSMPLNEVMVYLIRVDCLVVFLLIPFWRARTVIPCKQCTFPNAGNILPRCCAPNWDLKQPIFLSYCRCESTHGICSDCIWINQFVPIYEVHEMVPWLHPSHSAEQTFAFRHDRFEHSRQSERANMTTTTTTATATKDERERDEKQRKTNLVTN